MLMQKAKKGSDHFLAFQVVEMAEGQKRKKVV